MKTRIQALALIVSAVGGLIGCLVAAPSPAFGQAAMRAVFVSNNGNLEGSVSSFTLNADLSPHFVTKLVTGTRPNTSVPCPGCNAYEISLTPNGKFLALAHPAGDQDGLSIVRVESNAGLTLTCQVTMTAGQDAPMDVQWLDNQYLAVLRAEPNPDQVAIYRYNAGFSSLTQVNVYLVGTGGGYLAVHPSGQYLYVNNSSSPKQVYAFLVGANGTLTSIDAELSGTPFPLELAVSRDGTKLYAAGGISGSGHDVVGMSVAANGTLTLMAGSPFYSPGSSPSNVFVSDDNRYCIVGHGSDGTVRVLAIDQATGALTDTGYNFDVGIQGTVGDVRVMRDLLFVTDNFDGPTGLYSFRIGSGGALIQNGGLVSTTGVSPRSIATWTPYVAGDMDCDGDLDLDDIPAFVLALLDAPGYGTTYAFCSIGRGDMNADTFVDGADIQIFVNALAP
jgi:6-phosphogluconolactonase (cycloisomerase 2 family)